jgi:regulator of RNase E activity RraA
MKTFAFVSRHRPTQEQIEMALAQDIELVHIGDKEGFTVTKDDIGDCDGVVVVHGGMAMRLKDDYAIGIFENEMRPQEGAAPQFKAKQLHIWWKRDE